MDKTLAGLIGAVGTLAAVGSAQAAPVQPTLDDAMHAGSYADLLKPIPNASALLQQSDARAAEAQPEVMQVQYWAHHHHHHHAYYRRPYYHHHHHHAYYRRPYYHHHHHHHHRAAIIVPGVGIVVR